MPKTSLGERRELLMFCVWSAKDESGWEAWVVNVLCMKWQRRVWVRRELLLFCVWSAKDESGCEAWVVNVLCMKYQRRVWVRRVSPVTSVFQWTPSVHLNESVPVPWRSSSVALTVVRLPYVWQSETLSHHRALHCFEMQPFSHTSELLIISYCLKEIMIICETVQELSRWQTDKQTDRQTDPHHKQTLLSCRRNFRDGDRNLNTTGNNSCMSELVKYRWTTWNVEFSDGVWR